MNQEHDTEQAILERVRQKIVAYRLVFGGEQGRTVLDDLARFCRRNKTTFIAHDPGGRLSAHLEGRRDVLLYIEDNMDEGKLDHLVQLELIGIQNREESHV